MRRWRPATRADQGAGAAEADLPQAELIDLCGTATPASDPAPPGTPRSASFAHSRSPTDRGRSLSPLQGFDAIWAVADRLTKVRPLVPCRTNVDGAGLADLFVAHIFRLHGPPDSIAPDRGPRFAAAFWQRLCNCLGIGRRLSTAFHPESDGQTERLNAVTEQYLRAHVSYLQDD